MAEIISDQCRTCLTKDTELVSLVADHVVCDKVMSVLELIKTCTSAQIEVADGYPQYVCLQCIHSAEKSYEFRVQCEKVDNSLRTHVETFDCDVSEDNCENYEVLDPEFKSEENYLNILQNNIKNEEIDTYSCTICNFNFPTAAALTKHTSFSHQPNFYQCSHCPVRFITRELLDKHIVKHESKTDKLKKGKRKRKVDYVCAVCGKKYANLTVLNNHVRKHTSEEKSNKNSAETYICHTCDHHFISSEDLQRHMEKIHELKSEERDSINKFKCKYCFKLFTEEEDLQEHLTIHTKKKKANTPNKVSYKCKICALSAKSLPEIKDHLQTHDIKSKDIFSHLSYQCVECEQDFSTIYDYFNHSSTVHVGTKIEQSSATGSTRAVRKRPYTCDVPNCSKSFPSPSALKKHSLSHESQWPKKCRYCETVMNKWHDYMIHLNENHDDKKTFVCSQCGKKFFRERNLQSHMKTHNGERNYMCDFCGFSFLAQNNLVAHRRIHTGVKPYKCSYCPQAFAQHAGLRSHLLNHIGEKKHECPTCLKKFLRIGALRNHIKTHTGVKDYACHICGARFGASSTRKKHLLTHTGERNHICDFCGKAFSRRSNLSVHRKIHTGETPHVCEVCGKGFIQAHVLRSHMNTHKKRGEIKKEEKTEKNQIVQNGDAPEDITVLIEFD